jgi:cold shock CspA family protein
MFHLFDDAALHAHIHHLQGNLAPRRNPHHQKESLPMFLGTVCWRSKSPDRGYAFVRADAAAAIEGIQDGEIFVGQNVLKKCGATSIAMGDRVQFTTRASTSKPGRSEIATIKIVEQMAEAA